MSAPDVAYVLPLRWADDDGFEELDAYLQDVARWCELVVVDGSPPELFDRHHGAWSHLGRHVRPEPRGWLNGKVEGVTTGVGLCAAERVVVADDDVRYDAGTLVDVVAALDDADVVIPQNVLVPRPWHAWWDTGRTLLARATGGDFPGTLALRRSTFCGMGGYDGDVLFENLELIRTVQAHGGRVVRRPDLLVERRPPTARHFLGQRVRQAYDELARPARLAGQLAVLPLVTGALVARRPGAVATGALAAVVLAEVGRRLAGGARAFPPAASAVAPLWLGERAVTSWVAVWQRVRHGGVAYRGRRLATAAHSVAELRRRAESRSSALVAAGGPEADRLVGAVAERP